MENSLLNYMNKRFGDTSQKKNPGPHVAGPAITISREVGCGGLKLAKELATSLNKSVFCKKWQVISKEILQHSAEELKLDTQKVNRLFTPTEHSTFDEILEAFNAKSYKSDRVILKTVREVIRGFAVDGCCIIVGRAGNVIGHDIDNSLHLRLVAPLDWRIEKIAAKHHVTLDEARHFIVETERKRDTFRKYYMQKRDNQLYYDLVINVAKFKNDKIIELILAAVELKGILEKYKSSVSYF
ncbi:MAG TPA: cytidylate kinase-like family protein [Sunxiuqinia sp.]|nr:cytidylate kinase-like family protein [Sunxiuqinia sp.]